VDRTACELVKQDHEKKQRERNELMSKMFDWGARPRAWTKPMEVVRFECKEQT